MRVFEECPHCGAQVPWSQEGLCIECDQPLNGPPETEVNEAEQLDMDALEAFNAQHRAESPLLKLKATELRQVTGMVAARVPAEQIAAFLLTRGVAEDELGAALGELGVSMHRLRMESSKSSHFRMIGYMLVALGLVMFFFTGLISLSVVGIGVAMLLFGDNHLNLLGVHGEK